MLDIEMIVPRVAPPPSEPRSPVQTVDVLGVFGAMSLLAVLHAGAEPGFHCLHAASRYGERLAPHRALRHRILAALIEASVLAPVPTKRRLDDVLADGTWDVQSLEDADWLIQWDGNGSTHLPHVLSDFLDSFESTPRTREMLLEAWHALGTAECLAFAEYALASHNLNPAIARSAASSLQPLLAQLSIGHGCAVMWFATKHLAAWFLRHGGMGPASAEKELSRSVTNHVNRALIGQYAPIKFARHNAVPLSTFANVFIWTSGLGDDYWTMPISEAVLDRARPIGSVARILP